MVNLIIAGVPKNLKISQFIDFLETNIFQEKIKVGVNYIRWYKRDLKKLSLKMRSNDARKAIRYLDGFEYVSRKNKYTLVCWKEGSEDRCDSEDDFEPPSKMPRTLSPLDEPDELQVIDHKIELIRKQRILLEEESLLLLQKKRLEMIQNLGPNDFQKLSKLEELSEINQPSTETRVKGKSGKPNFQRPWQIIYEKMKSVIKAYVNVQDRPIFIDLLRSRVKNRLAIILKDKGNMKAKEILALYRSIHPEESDISLVQEVLVKINQSIFPIDITTKCYGEKNDQDNPTDEVISNYLNENVEKNGMKDTQKEESAFYEDVYGDLDNNIKQATTEKDIGFERDQSTDKKIKDEVINILESETNITDVENCEVEVYKPKEINKNEFKETESHEISEETNLNIVKEICTSESEIASLDTNKQIEPYLNEVVDMDNDLDDWIEDDNDQKEINAP